MESLTLSAGQTAKWLGLGRNRVYMLLREGKLPAVRAGRRFRVLASDLEEALRKLATEGEEGGGK